MTDIFADFASFNAKVAGRKPKKEPSGKALVGALNDIVVKPIGLAQQYSRIGGDLTPAKVSSILREADSGRTKRFVDLVYECREKDNHLHSTLQVRELAVSGLKQTCVATEQSPKQAQEGAAVMTEALKKALNFRDSINHLVSAGSLFANGWAEVIWDYVDGYMIPVAFEPVPARQFFYRRIDGRLLFSPTGIAEDENTGLDLETFPRGKFIRWRPKIMGDVPWRDGLGRPLLWAALFRNWATRDWLTLAELAWKPWRTGQFKKDGAQKEDIAKLIAILEQMSASGIGVFPDSVDVNIEWPKQNVGSAGKTPHQMLIEYFAREISKTTLGATDLQEPGDVGARSATEVRERINLLLRDAVVAGVQASIQSDLVIPFMEMNFGAEADPFDYAFETQDAADVSKFSTAMKDMALAGVRISSTWARNQIGSPEPQEGEETFGGPQETGGDEPPKGDGDAGKKPKKPKKPEKPATNDGAGG